MNTNFLWGGASSAPQMEGAYRADGKGLTIADVITVGGKTKAREITAGVKEELFYPSHTAIDFYHTFSEDLKWLKKLGLKSYRFSISWARIFPNGDDPEPNEAGLAFYDKVIDTLVSYGIEPIVTLVHIDFPLNLTEKYGSWTNRKLIDLFLRYAQTVMERYKGKVKYWLTFNEINHAIPKNDLASAIAFMSSGVELEKYENKEQAVADVVYHMLLATSKTVLLAHSIDQEMKVSIMNSMIPIYPDTCNPLDVMESVKQSEDDFFLLDVLCRGKYPAYKLNKYKMAGIKLPVLPGDEEAFKNGTIDYIAFSYYMSNVASVDTSKVKVQNAGFSVGIDNPYLETTPWGFTIDPVGLRYSLNVLYNRYQLPIMVVENGIGGEEELVDGEVHDNYRIEYLKKHIVQLKLAIEVDGVDCFGYHTWTPIDLVSGSSGEMEKRYGFVYVDLDNQLQGSGKRLPKDSFYWYQNVIKSNGEEL
ncbi:glycoside hydrolase family 1 protein [Enterococcus hulanensis]|uniref:glycoside hydrolase family 1 protein n=1 Tax=Enterococcus TaxID=1350 RepID=UPI000B5A9B69|nr:MULTISPECIES: glycoside hydrolase family 1 protein [Enterococcus]MBO0413001.1 glycoside hydrolase family 1 protein [Enterococcus hulanensis]OTO21777.1 hypothetical protein A5875_003159 [Enterococcus sp. 3H8_DIV0648]